METFIGQGPTPGTAPGGGRPTLTAIGLRIAGGDGLNGGAAADSFLLDISLISILLRSKSGFDFSLFTHLYAQNISSNLDACTRGRIVQSWPGVDVGGCASAGCGHACS